MTDPREAFKGTAGVSQKLKQEEYGGYFISTVFLRFSLDGVHFETAIFPLDQGKGLGEDLWREQAVTYEEAIRLHQKAIDRITNNEV